MLFHDLKEEWPNVINFKLDCSDCSSVEISNDGKLIAIGWESGKIELFEFFDTFGPPS